MFVITNTYVNDGLHVTEYWDSLRGDFFGNGTKYSTHAEAVEDIFKARQMVNLMEQPHVVTIKEV